jgi:hypothetical protein
MTAVRFTCLGAVAALAFPAAAQAQTVGDNYWIEASYFLPHVSSEIQINQNGSTTPGSEVDLESTL